MSHELRHLVLCAECAMQYDASGLKPGDRFNCGCGALVEVSAPKAHEAAVVRCSSCGAPRQDREPHCSFCNSDFTLHERDLHTICPSCTARISDQAKFCHSCGMTISVQAHAGMPTEFDCPACAEQKLQSRKLDARNLSVLECGRCAGLWVGNEIFEQLAANAEEIRTAVQAIGGDNGTSDGDIRKIEEQERLYRPCPACRGLMHRRNYGRKSGVIVDTCRNHGIWFDHGELVQILAWLKSGGAKRAQLEVDLEKRAIDRHEALYPVQQDPPESGRGWGSFYTVIKGLVNFGGSLR